MTDLEGVIELLKDAEKVIEACTKIIIAITAPLVAIAAFLGKLGEMWEKVLKPLWNKVLRPFSRFTAISLTLIIPNGIIIWIFVYWVAEDLTPIIRNREVFSFVVACLTAIVSAYSLLWGMRLYPAMIRRPLSNKGKTQLNN